MKGQSTKRRYRKDVNTLAIIPAFNEATTLPKVLAGLQKELPEHDIIVINDGSTDGTEIVAEKAGVDYLSLPFNLGIGGALRLGFRYAVEQDYEVAYQFDADGQHDPSQVKTILKALDNADMAIGNRFAGNTPYRIGRSRTLAMGILKILVNRITGQSFSDTSSGFRAFRKPVLELFAKNYPVEYMDSVEALILAIRNGFRVTEVPVNMQDRLAGKPSNRNFRLIYYFTRLLIVLILGSRKNSVQMQ